MTDVTRPSSGSLSLPATLAFAAAGLPINAVILAVAVYLPRHYASHLGLDLALVGAAFFLVRAIDIPVEGLLGWMMDATRTRWGRYRVWTLIGLPLFLLGVGMVFLAAPGVSKSYLVAWLLVMYLGMSILTLSHLAWASTLAQRYDERSKLFGLMMAVGVVGAASVIILSIARGAMKLPDAGSVPAMALFVMMVAPVLIGLMVWLTPERVSPDTSGHQKFGWRDYAALLARPSFARLILADLCVSLGPGWMSAIYLFFFTDSRGFTTGQASILLAAYILAGVLGAPLLGRLAVRISKHRTLMAACIGYSAMLASFMLLPKGNMPVFLVGMFLAGFLASSFTATTRAMTADIADEVRLDHGRERAGLLYAMTTMTNKITGALSIGLTFSILAKVGYAAREGATNTPDAIRNLELVYLIGPIFFVTLGAACMIGYPLSAERHAEIRRRLDQRDADAASGRFTEEPVIETITSEGRAVAS